MPRSQLLRSTLADRERLRWLGEFFRWVYAEHRPPGELALRFWALWSQLHGHDLSRRRRAAWQHAISKTPAAGFEKIQDAARVWVNNLLGVAHDGETMRVKGEEQYLVAWLDADGRRYFEFGRDPFAPVDTLDLVDDIGRDVMHQLRGLSVEVLGQCEGCGRAFLRLRARRRKYCSARCKYEAAPSTQRLRERRRRSAARRRAARKAKR